MLNNGGADFEKFSARTDNCKYNFRLGGYERIVDMICNARTEIGWKFWDKFKQGLNFEIFNFQISATYSKSIRSRSFNAVIVQNISPHIVLREKNHSICFVYIRDQSHWDEMKQRDQ